MKDKINNFIAYKYLISWRFPLHWVMEEEYLDTYFPERSYIYCRINYYKLHDMTPLYVNSLKSCSV